MSLLQILADTLEIRGHIQVTHPMAVNDTELHGEVEEKVVEQTALHLLK